MALSSRARNRLNDENSRPAGKKQLNAGPETAGRPRLKPQQQQPQHLKEQQQQQHLKEQERRILSDISNTKPSFSSFGTPRPSPKPGLSVFRSENLRPRSAAPPPPSSQKPLSRIPLRNIVNESQPDSSVPGGTKAAQKKRTGPKIRLSAEQLRQADEWSKEDLPIEKTHFTGQDMEALREKLMEAEIEETVALVRNYSGAWTLPDSRPAIDHMEESLYFKDGRLRPDHREFVFDEEATLRDTNSDAGPPAEDIGDLIPFNSNIHDDFELPAVPEAWHVVRGEDEGHTV